MNTKFPVLSTLSSFLRKSGWVIVAAGVLYAVWEGIFEPMQGGHHFSGQDLFQLISGLTFSTLGLIVVAFSEVIGVLFAIEENTRTNFKKE